MPSPPTLVTVLFTLLIVLCALALPLTIAGWVTLYQLMLAGWNNNDRSGFDRFLDLWTRTVAFVLATIINVILIWLLASLIIREPLWIQLPTQ